jgi:hypothetical protein
MYHAQLKAPPKDSISSQILSAGALTSTAVVLMHKPERSELIYSKVRHEEGHEVVHYGEEAQLRRFTQAATSEKGQKDD